MIEITKKHAGANIEVISKEGNEFKLKQELRDSSTNWFYWNFAADGCKGDVGKFSFKEKLIGIFGPGISDNFTDWRFAKKECTYDEYSFSYTFKKTGTVYFSFSLPYQLEHFERFYQRKQQSYGFIEKETLIRSPQNREIPVMQIKIPGANKDIVFSCRHHCCESVASYMLEGIIDYILENITGFKDYNIHILPFADLDGVENGDQGKNRIPHDHNRDYTGKPIYESVQKWMDYVCGLNLVCGFDLHCPWKWGTTNDIPQIVYGNFVISENQKFSETLEQVTKNSAIRYKSEYDFPIGRDWNRLNPTASHFYLDCGAALGFTFEVPYFGKEVMYSIENVHNLGRDFSRAVKEYLS